MTVFAVTNTFQSQTTITAAGHNTNWSDVTTWLNNRYNGSDTWSFMKVSSSNGNPVDVTSSASSTEVSINNTATDGDPLLSFKLSGSQIFVIGVDDSDSDLIKFATTSLTTNIAMQIPAAGNQVQFSAGNAAAPGISYGSEPSSGFFFAATGDIRMSLAGTSSFRWSSGGFVPVPSGTMTCGSSANKWSEVWATNGTIQTCHSSTKEAIVGFSEADIKLPEAVKFARPGDKHNQKQIGFLADDLPEECFAIIDEEGNRSKNSVYLSSVVGIICASLKKIEERISALEK